MRRLQYIICLSYLYNLVEKEVVCRTINPLSKLKKIDQEMNGQTRLSCFPVEHIITDVTSSQLQLGKTTGKPVLLLFEM